MGKVLKLMPKTAVAAPPAKPQGLARKAPAPAAEVKPGGLKRKVRDDDDGDGDGSAAGRTKGPGVTSGWDGAEQLKKEQAAFSNILKIEAGDEFLIRFLDDEPYANVRTHWLQRKGKRSFICPGDKCPLCAAGYEVKISFAFNVIKLGETDPELFSWEVSTRVLNQIRELAVGKWKPLSSKFYTVKRTGKKMNDTVYNLSVVKKDEDIAEEYEDVYVPDADEIAAITEKRYITADVMKQVMKISDLREIANESGEDDEDDD